MYVLRYVDPTCNGDQFLSNAGSDGMIKTNQHMNRTSTTRLILFVISSLGSMRTFCLLPPQLNNRFTKRVNGVPILVISQANGKVSVKIAI